MTHSLSSTWYNETGNAFLWRARLRWDGNVYCACLMARRNAMRWECRGLRVCLIPLLSPRDQGSQPAAWRAVATGWQLCEAHLPLLGSGQCLSSQRWAVCLLLSPPDSRMFYHKLWRMWVLSGSSWINNTTCFGTRVLAVKSSKVQVISSRVTKLLSLS